jgi:predicted small lipoprotein YifL
MFGLLQILVSVPARRCLLAAALLAALSACGQKGNLILPTGEAAQGRATLPETLDPTSRTGSGTAIVPTTAASAVPPTGVVNPVHNQ